MSGGIFGCLGLGVGGWGQEGGAVGIQRVEARDTAEHPMRHRTDPATKDGLDQSAHSVQAEKP